MTDGLFDEVLQRPWFYEFTLLDGRQTRSYLPPKVADIHPTRAAKLDTVVRRAFPQGLAGTSALDLACHEGFFAQHLRRLGCESVFGVDIRR